MTNWFVKRLPECGLQDIVIIVESMTQVSRPRTRLPRPKIVKSVLEDPRGQGHDLEDSITVIGTHWLLQCTCQYNVLIVWTVWCVDMKDWWRQWSSRSRWRWIIIWLESPWVLLSPVSTTRVDGWPVSITRQHGPCWRARVSTSRVDGYFIYLYLYSVRMIKEFLCKSVANSGNWKRWPRLRPWGWPKGQGPIWIFKM